MTALEVQVGSTITNGSSALRVTERVEKDPRWGTSGWRGMCIPLEQFGGNAGMTDFVPDYLLSSWHHVPFEWAECPGRQVEERYVWETRYRWLQREVRQMKIEGERATLVIIDEPHRIPVDCRAEHGEGHPDCPKCWRWSERNPNRIPRS